MPSNTITQAIRAQLLIISPSEIWLANVLHRTYLLLQKELGTVIQKEAIERQIKPTLKKFIDLIKTQDDDAQVLNTLSQIFEFKTDRAQVSFHLIHLLIISEPAFLEWLYPASLESPLKEKVKELLLLRADGMNSIHATLMGLGNIKQLEILSNLTEDAFLSLLMEAEKERPKHNIKHASNEFLYAYSKELTCAELAARDNPVVLLWILLQYDDLSRVDFAKVEYFLEHTSYRRNVPAFYSFPLDLLLSIIDRPFSFSTSLHRSWFSQVDMFRVLVKHLPIGKWIVILERERASYEDVPTKVTLQGKLRDYAKEKDNILSKKATEIIAQFDSEAEKESHPRSLAISERDLGNMHSDDQRYYHQFRRVRKQLEKSIGDCEKDETILRSLIIDPDFLALLKADIHMADKKLILLRLINIFYRNNNSVASPELHAFAARFLAAKTRLLSQPVEPSLLSAAEYSMIICWVLSYFQINHRTQLWSAKTSGNPPEPAKSLDINDELLKDLVLFAEKIKSPRVQSLEEFNGILAYIKFLLNRMDDKAVIHLIVFLRNSVNEDDKRFSLIVQLMQDHVLTNATKGMHEYCRKICAYFQEYIQKTPNCKDSIGYIGDLLILLMKIHEITTENELREKLGALMAKREEHLNGRLGRLQNAFNPAAEAENALFAKITDELQIVPRKDSPQTESLFSSSPVHEKEPVKSSEEPAVSQRFFNSFNHTPPAPAVEFEMAPKREKEPVKSSEEPAVSQRFFNSFNRTPPAPAVEIEMAPKRNS